MGLTADFRVWPRNHQLDNFIGFLIRIRNTCNFWIAKPDVRYVEAIREAEILKVVGDLPKGERRILEIGAGAGWQAKYLGALGYQVSAIDLASGIYRQERIWPVIEYDGKRIPFPENEFDVVFSSNTLEHIPAIVEFQSEIQRVLKQDGLACHVLPSSAWRFWTALTHLVKRWSIPVVHGESAGNVVSEMYYFSKKYWRSLFENSGWMLCSVKPTKIFYTGELVMGSRISLSNRGLLSRVLGSACNIYLMKKSPLPRGQAGSE
jgi:SAM-dependent methyltransferase